ncbi:threonine/serine dehydratase [Streptomyces sp. NPDC096198]|uniref:threonine ammonia-lyase n=1 Tax=Streptomyces sp. NPDC096198 TaxID=3366080 RepID=UPI0037F23B12
MTITSQDVLRAAQKLQGVAVRTPLLTSAAFDGLVGRQVLLKAENQQLTGSFKFRGAYNAVGNLNESQRHRGVIGGSSGNHAQALALAARQLHTKATVVIPGDAPAAKTDAIKALGARIITYDRIREQRDAIVYETAHSKGLAIIPSSNHRSVIAGAGTVAWEMVQDAPRLAVILVPIGGGGLAAGTVLAAHAYNPRLKVIGVEPVTANDTHRSLRAGRAVLIPPPATIADGLRHTRPESLPFEIIKSLISDVITVPEGAIVDSMAYLWSHYHTAAEPSGAVALAALLHAPRSLPDGPVGVVVSGGNADWAEYRTLLDIAMERKERNAHAIPVLR